MKARILIFLLAGCLLALGAWLVHGPNPPQRHTPSPDPAADPVQAEVSQARSLEIVQKGLEYLVKNQHADGHWEGDGGQHPVAMTGLVGLALLMEGSTVRQGKYSANIRKAVDWLMDQSQAGRGGLIYSGHASETERYMIGHGLATQFLGWASHTDLDATRQKKLDAILKKAVNYIAKAQSTQGGWYRTSKVEGHELDEITATAIQIQALSMLQTGLHDSELCRDGKEYLKTVLEKHEKGAKKGPNRPTAAEIAAALACRSESFGFDGQFQKWMKYCQTEISVGRTIQFGRDDLAHYYYAQAVFNLTINGSPDNWKTYRKAMFDHLQASQNKDGSWPAPLASQMGIGVGPIYSTVLWCTILQLETKRHPLTPATEKEQF